MLSPFLLASVYMRVLGKGKRLMGCVSYWLRRCLWAAGVAESAAGDMMSPESTGAAAPLNALVREYEG